MDVNEKNGTADPQIIGHIITQDFKEAVRMVKAADLLGFGVQLRRIDSPTGGDHEECLEEWEITVTRTPPVIETVEV